MNAIHERLLSAFETHDVDEIRAVLDAGFDAASSIDGVSVVNQLLEMYFRSDRFPACLQLLLERGGVLDDPSLAPVLLNDAGALTAAVAAHPALLRHRTQMRCTFTPLDGATLLHVAAEYGHVAVTERLLALGADPDAAAAVDADGLNGQTPLFHTVNSNANRSAPVMRLLLAAGARADVRLRGITWGRGFDWETVCYDVTPLSYAQLGLLPQMHRAEADVYANIAELLAAQQRPAPRLANVPNRYLQ
ncbi:ankyrin repeat protein [Pelomonas saccharophila]|uniref:Ankyrin repeat protein n=1 Tax=Roseateles saccharophilus TaxID=304 RepID=A0ABU1YWK3_ROSSA|nr:ankyrin repeat domain-containing protein [Roseateles saccharophilus]MDR7272381.1 ankyrin repeat protein [Roseateles saccharophilus]